MSDERKFNPDADACIDCAFFQNANKITGRGWCYRHPPVFAGHGFDRPEVDGAAFCGEGRLPGERA